MGPIARAGGVARTVSAGLLLGLAAGCAATPPDDAVDPGAGGSSPGQEPTPFGSHRFPYPAGSIRPSGAQAELDAAVALAYDRWKQAYLVEGCGGYYVRTGGGTGADDALTVSEGHGYGMIATAIMAGHDPAAQATFDGLYRFFRSVPSARNRQLMAWAVGADCRAQQPANSATDGDLDIALALLLANRQWGSAGAVDYLGEARKVVSAIDRSEMNQSTRLPLLGDWAPGSGPLYFATRPSDFMPGHFRAFAALSGRPGWGSSVDRVYAVVADVQSRFAAATGLLPDFLANTQSGASPPSGRILETQNDDDYSWNSCRVPWRLGSDFVVSGDERARRALHKISDWIKATTGGDASRVVDGYRLDGSELGRGDSAAYIAPFGVAAMVDAAHQGWLDAVWRWLVAEGRQGYYADSIRLLSMIVMSGNWWAP